MEETAEIRGNELMKEGGHFHQTNGDHDRTIDELLAHQPTLARRKLRFDE